jgi:vanillate/4-hydroxybenzoate decarboxylase subunit D
METCPRCAHSNIRLEHEGKEEGKLIWSSYYCESCNYSFRDSEPENILVRAKRTPYFNLDSVDPANFKTLLPANIKKK